MKLKTLKYLIGLILFISACNQAPKNTKKTINADGKELELTVPEFSEDEKAFSDKHFEVGIDAIKTLKNEDYKELETYMVTEFLPPDGFAKMDFMVNIAKYIQDKELPAKEQVKMKIGRNEYKGTDIAYKRYEFPFYIIEGRDTTGRSAILITFADAIEKNKIANLSFRDY